MVEKTQFSLPAAPEGQHGEIKRQSRGMKLINTRASEIKINLPARLPSRQSRCARRAPSHVHDARVRKARCNRWNLAAG